MSQDTDVQDRPSTRELLTLWTEIGHLALAGMLRVSDVRQICEAIVLYAVWLGSEKNITHTMKKSGSNRKRIEEVVAGWQKMNESGLLALVRQMTKTQQRNPPIVVNSGTDSDTVRLQYGSLRKPN